MARDDWAEMQYLIPVLIRFKSCFVPRRCEISYERDQDDGSLKFLECYAMGRAGPKR